MRKIKFRGKRLAEDNELYAYTDTGEWVYGSHSYYIGKEIRFIEDGKFDVYEVSAKTVGQYTGRKDKKGQEIYEGDILHREVAFPGKSGDYYYVVKPIDDYLEKGETYGIFSVHLWESECEVIGNVHDNPELVVE